MAAIAAAQSTEPSANSPSTTAADQGSQAISPVFEDLGGRIEHVGPDTFILLDAQGRPQPVLNMPLEAFIEAWKAQQNIEPSDQQGSPQYTLDECRLVGSLEGNHAALSARLQITLHSDEPLEVPLGMAGALLRKLPEPPANRRDARFLRYDATAGGYLATLEGEVGERVQVDLELLVPVRRDGARATLEMRAPRATIGTLVLVSRNNVQSVAASEGVLLTTSPLAAGGLRIEAEGVAGEFSLSWVDRPTTPAMGESVISASSEVLVSIDSRDIRNSARITVQSFGQSFREFTVRLPPGARYVDTGPSGLEAPFESVRVVDDSSQVGEEAGSDAMPRTELAVTLVADQSEPVTLEVRTIQPLHSTGNGIRLELSGFEVVGAVPQDGEVGIQVDDAWQLRWDTSDDVRFVHPTELDLTWASPQATSENLTAALRFARQPWKLPVQLVPREERYVATPTYDLTILPGEALLRMQVSYRIEGGRTLRTLFMPSFTLEGWDHLQTTTLNMDEAEQMFEQADKLTFETAYATNRRPVVTLEFRRPLPDDNSQLFVLRLPKPEHEGLVLNSSDVNVSVDTSVELTPDLNACVGLVPMAIEDDSDSERGSSPGQEFRYRGVYPPLVFAARKKPRPQRVLVASHSHVTLSSDQVLVTQTLDFDVRHQPISTLVLAMPSGLMAPHLELLPIGGPDASELGAELDVPAAIPSENGALPTLPERRIALPHPRLGRFRIQAKYELEPMTSSVGNYVLSLLSVPGTELTENVVELESTLPESLMPTTGSGWRMIHAGTGPAPSVMVTDRQNSFLPLTLSGRSPTADALEINKVWVQTWLTSRTMQMRSVFQFVGTASNARVELPNDVPDGEQFEVMLDGATTTNWVRDKEMLVIDLPEFDEPRSRTLEVRYRLPATLEWLSHVTPGRPQLVGNQAGSEFLVWQVIAPVEYQWTSAAPALISASHTAWSQGDWRSVSEQDTASIEQWIGAQADSLRPTVAEHTLLFRAWPDANLEVTLIRRELLVLATSGSVLAMCLLLAYVPWMRRLPVLLLMATALAAGGLASPQMAATLAPLGFFGLVCGLLMWVLLVMYGPREAGSSTSHVAGTTHGDSATHRQSTLVPVGVAPASTDAPTASMELTDSNV